MNPDNLPTKRNFLSAKRKLQLANHGHSLLDMKYKVLTRELSAIKKNIHSLREELINAISTGCKLLPVEICNIKKISDKMPLIKNLQITYKSVMGVKIPQMAVQEPRLTVPPYSLGETSSNTDKALLAWQKVTKLLIQLAEAEVSERNILIQMKKAQKRAAALKNITIPKLESRIKYISAQLEERERDELARVKSVKS